MFGVKPVDLAVGVHGCRFLFDFIAAAAVKGSIIRPFPGFENAAGKLRHKW